MRGVKIANFLNPPSRLSTSFLQEIKSCLNEVIYKLKSTAGDLRRYLTLQERKLWRYLRSRRFGDFKFRRQHPVGSYILDFACCSARVVVELDGGQHDLAVAYDTRRTSWLESQSWTVLRFWHNEIDCNEEAVLEIILQELNRRSPSP